MNISVESGIFEPSSNASRTSCVLFRTRTLRKACICLFHPQLNKNFKNLNITFVLWTGIDLREGKTLNFKLWRIQREIFPLSFRSTHNDTGSKEMESVMIHDRFLSEGTWYIKKQNKKVLTDRKYPFRMKNEYEQSTTVN